MEIDDDGDDKGDCGGKKVGGGAGGGDGTGIGDNNGDATKGVLKQKNRPKRLWGIRDRIVPPQPSKMDVLHLKTDGYFIWHSRNDDV